MARIAIIPTYKAYNKADIFKELDAVKCILNEDENETYYHDKLIRKFYVGKKFENFDFSTFFKNIVNEMESIYSIENYILKIYSGVQELKLLYAPFTINGESYYNCLTLLNSTDTTKTLQIVPCLYKVSGNITMVMHGDTIMEQARHYSLSIDSKTTEATFKLNKLQKINDNQNAILRSLIDKDIKMSTIASGYKDKSTDNYKFNSFRHRIKISENNAIEIDEKLQKVLDTSINFVAEKKFDYTLNLYKSFVCFSEVFRNRDIHEIKRECLTFLKKTKIS